MRLLADGKRFTMIVSLTVALLNYCLLQNKDLTWYAKDRQKEPHEKEKEIQDEVARIKQQEADVLAMALGYSGPMLMSGMNRGEVGQDELKRVLKSAETGEEIADGHSGLGFGKK